MTWVSSNTHAGTNITASAGAFYGLGSIYVIRMNSPYDPCSATLTTFDQCASNYTFWSRLYNHYRTIKAKIVTKFRQVGPVADSYRGAPLLVGCRIDDDSTLAYTGWEQLTGDPKVKFKVMNWTATGGDSNEVTLTQWYVAKRDAFDKADAGAMMGYNPTDIVYACPFYQSLTKVSIPTGVPDLNIYQHITYYVELTESREPTEMAAQDAIVQM